MQEGIKVIFVHSLIPFLTAMRRSWSLLLTQDSVSTGNEGLEIVTSFSGSGLESCTCTDSGISVFFLENTLPLPNLTFSRAESIFYWGFSGTGSDTEFDSNSYTGSDTVTGFDIVEEADQGEKTGLDTGNDGRSSKKSPYPYLPL